MRTHATNRVGNTSLQNCQILENLLEISRFPFPKIQFSSPKIQFYSMAFRLSSTAFCFLQWLSGFTQWLSAFLNGFPLSKKSEKVYLIFLNGLPLSKKSEKIYLRQQVYERSTIWASYFLPHAPWASWFLLQCLHLTQQWIVVTPFSVVIQQVVLDLVVLGVACFYESIQ